MNFLRRQRGISIMEVLIGGGIAAIAYMGAVKVVSGLGKQTTKIRATQSTDIQVEQAFRLFSREVANSALLRPAEGLLTANDGTYNGVAGINGNDYSVSGCKFAGSASEESASVIRYTQLLDKIRPERLVRAWDEKDISNTPLRVSLPNNQTGSLPLASDRKPHTQELVVLDADNIDLRRYEIVSSAVDTTRNVLPFNHLTLNLKMPRSANGTGQTAVARRFITDSVAFAATTKVSCLSNQDEWITITEATGKAEPVLKLGAEGWKIQKLEFRYLASKSNQRLDRSLFGLYPYQDLTQALCLNTLQVIAELMDSRNPTANPSRHVNTISLSNFQMRRAAICDP